MSYQERADALFEDQKTSWPLLGSNWELLKEARIKSYAFDGFTVQVQCNPKRIVSSAAKVDKVSIENRSCFLCTQNLPPEEKNEPFEHDYVILCNPFPIFNEHFTIAKREHTPQVIEPEFLRFLELSRHLSDLVVFYNAPACGASAPDHMHFQAGNRGFMPIEQEIGSLRETYGKLLYRSAEISVTAIEDGLRRFILLESDQAPSLQEVFLHIFQFTRELQHGEEPMINILSYYSDHWQLLVFPRSRHRPWQYFEEGEKNILLSPAAVDMGGMLITPLEKDFEKITREDIEDIFTQVLFSDWHFNALSSYLSDKLQSHA